MIFTEFFRRHFRRQWAGAGGLLLLATGNVQAQSTTFNFVLDEPCKTSAGVYTPDGTLVRTLWSKVRYLTAGTNSAVWDGLDDSSNAAPPGTYMIKLLQHNTEYVWDGAIGNTSAEISGPTVHHGFHPMRDLAISGTNAYYSSGYNEKQYDFRCFSTLDPQRVKQFFSPGYKEANESDCNWNWVAADGELVYFACSQTPDSSNAPLSGAIFAYNVSDASHYFFSQGIAIQDNNGETYPNGIKAGTQPGLSGLAVQNSGNLLAAAVSTDNRIYLFDKKSGAGLTNFAATAPTRISFSPDGSLWAITGTTVRQFTNLLAGASAATTISGFAEPLAVAVNPTNANLILVADGGSSQQVKAFDATGAAVWTYGLAGGYPSNGIAVTTDKFWFFDGENDGTFITFAPDSSFWVGDGANHRTLHFSAARQYLEQIMYQPRSLLSSVDQNDTSRVFNQFLEFKVDYTKPLSQGWTLVKNWRANVDAAHIDSGEAEGVFEVTTLTNGRTYALIKDATVLHEPSEVCELTTNQIRFTGLVPAIPSDPNERGWTSLGPDGSVRRATIGAPRWYQATLNSFDASNNPVWNPETLIVGLYTNFTDPYPHHFDFGLIRTTFSDNNILITFDQSRENCWHLGGIRPGSSNWLWKASPAVQQNNDGRGGYEISDPIQYCGNTVQAMGRNIIYGFHGENFRGLGQASQTMHFYDDGLFVGQFGEASNNHDPTEGSVAAFAGNCQCRDLVKAGNGDYYVWLNDEGAHGPQRWHMVNAKNIREQSGTGVLGVTITLTNEPMTFPVNVRVQDGNQSAKLSWTPVPGATSYNVRYSLLNGGPHTVVAANTSGSSQLVTGLTNGQTYYFVVSALAGGAEGVTSEQVVAHPFDTTQFVLLAGSTTDGGNTTVMELSSNAPPLGLPSYIGAEHPTGVLNLRELDYYGFGALENELVGTAGYYSFDLYGKSTLAEEILPPFTIPDYLFPPNYSGWGQTDQLRRECKLDGTAGDSYWGYIANPVGTIPIVVSDTNYHFLTIVSPSRYNNVRKFVLGITSTNGSSVQYVINEPRGYNHEFQFRFKGDITLWADGTGGADANVQTLFMDNAAVTFDQAVVPPTPILSGIQLSGSDLLLNAGGGQAGVTYLVLSATALSTPLNQWLPVATNTLSASGNFSVTLTNGVQSGAVPRFYRLQVK